MLVGTHPTRNFATFGPSELRPPFTGGYNQNLDFGYLALQHRAGVSPYTCSYELAETWVFVKLLLPSLLCQHHRCHSFFRSYGVNLPSSFNKVLPSTLVYSTSQPVSVCSTVNIMFVISAISRKVLDYLRAYYPRNWLMDLKHFVTEIN